MEIGAKVAEICRAHFDRETDLGTLFDENGFEKPERKLLEKIARIEAYRTRLLHAERHPTYQPDPSEFEDDQNELLVRLEATVASETSDIFIHADAVNLYVYVSDSPKRRCGFTYNGRFTDWPDILGFTSQNSKQISNPFVYQTPAPPLAEVSIRSGLTPELGGLQILSQTFEPAEFGGRHPITIWLLIR